METSEVPLTDYAVAQVHSARTFAMVGFIFFAIMGAIWAMVTAAIVIASLGRPTSFGILVFPVFLALSVGFAIWAWNTIKVIDAGHYSRAQTSALLLGIIGIFPPIGAIIAGVFFILAFWKLSLAVTYAEAPPPIYAARPPPVARICTECGRAIPTDAKFCPHCGKALA